MKYKIALMKTEEGFSALVPSLPGCRKLTRPVPPL